MEYDQHIKRKLDSLGFDTGSGSAKDVEAAFNAFAATLATPHEQPRQGLLARFAGFIKSKFSGHPAPPPCPDTVLRELNRRAGLVFSEVFQFELDYLAGKKDAPPPSVSIQGTTTPPGPAVMPPVPPAPTMSTVIAAAHKAELAGLALSGGGIRSATFNLGILQALAKLGLLKEFHYLSTVSGGGYIGGWLSRWIKEEGGDVAKVEEKLANAAASPGNASSTATAAPDPGAPRAEPAEIQFLRRYSNYLTPQTGMFSADTWTLIGTYFRNTLLNMTMLVAWLSALFLIPRLFVFGIEDSGGLMGPVAWLAGGFFLWAVHAIAYSISYEEKSVTDPRQTQGRVLLKICVPLMASGLLGSMALAYHAQALAAYWRGWPGGTGPIGHAMLALPGIAYFLAWASGWGRAQWVNRGEFFREKGWRALLSVPGDRTASLDKLLREAAGHFLYAVGALAVGTVLVLMTLSALFDASAIPVPGEAGQRTWPAGSAVYLATFGMPLLLFLFAVTITLMIGLIGRLYSDQSREWWARQGAWTTIFTVGWLVIFASAFFLPPLLHWAYDYSAATVTIGGAITSILTFVGLKSGNSKKTGAPGSSLKLDLVAQAAPYAFSVLVVAILTFALQLHTARPAGFAALKPQAEAAAAVKPGETPKVVVKSPPLYVEAYVRESAASQHAATVGYTLAGCALAALILGLRVDINKFSLYMMYRLRLVRAYFGASNKKRRPHSFTGFDPADDPELHTLLQQTGGGSPELQRPYHLINAALNLVNGKELAWQRRKAANFVFSPAYCGFEMPSMSSNADPHNQRPQEGAFRPTCEYASSGGMLLADDDATVKLGTAVAVSGAAASPNMGYHSSPPLAFLMTLFNLRLGRWCPNPMKEAIWRRSGPRVGLGSILSELFGLTDADADYLYLSDGGHFENLGIYELVRRRCRLIIAVDASCDEQQTFDDLGNAVRKCATDLHIPIKLNARNIRAYEPGKRDGAAVVLGTIQYSHADGKVPDGVLLYIKPTLVGTENADIHNYSKLHPDFPHQSTADQWFDEDQFESYRALGYEIGMSAFPPPPPPPPGAAAAHAAGAPCAGDPPAHALAPGLVTSLCLRLQIRHGGAANPLDDLTGAPDKVKEEADE